MLITQNKLTDSFGRAALSLLRHGDLDLAWEASEAGIQEIGEDRALTEYWVLRFIRIQIHTLRGQVDEAINCLDSFGNPRSQDTESVVSLSMHRGYLLGLSGRYDSSRSLLSGAEAMASASDLPELQGEVRVRQAAVACLEHDFDNAQRLYLSLVNNEDNKFGDFLRCVAVAGVGKTFIGLKQFRDAILWFEKALAIATSEDFGLLRPAIIGGMGVSYLQAGDSERSLELHLEMDRLLSKSGLRRSYLVNLHDLGNVYLQRKDYGTAIAYYHRALEIAKELNFPAYVEGCTFNMRVAYIQFSSSLRVSPLAGTTRC